jgi:hypothetical protein
MSLKVYFIFERKAQNECFYFLLLLLLLLLLGQVSFAQERILLDEHIRFAWKGSIIYTIPLIYRISSGGDSDAVSISIMQLERALRAVVIKHKILRSALSFDVTAILKQYVLEMSSSIIRPSVYEFTVHDVNNGEQMSSIEERILRSDTFDLTNGRVLHCHIARHRQFSSKNDDLLSDDDIVSFLIHHSAFDGASVSLFLNDLCDAYNSDKPLLMNDDTLQYIDYASHERNMDMTISRDFWRSQLDGYNMENRLSLPVNRHRLSNDKRTGLASVIELTFDDNLSHSFLTYAASHRVTPFQLGLATFYAFLFKLTNGQNDLCIACINANRYRNELQNLIGMFVATLPYRLQLNPQHSFDQLVEQVRDRCLSILEHSHYPLQHILADSQHQEASPAFLETLFDFITLSSKSDRLTLNGAHLESVSLQGIDQVAKFDFMCTLLHNPSTENNTMSCSFVCSRDLFDQMTVERIARRFQHLLTQLFCSNTMMNQFDQVHQPIYKLSLLLPEEVAELEQTMFQRCLNIGNAGMV